MSKLKLEDLYMTRGVQEYAELGIFLDLLRALSFLHQTHHWQASGANFMGDHVLYSRLYDTTNGEIDGVGERAVGLGVPELVNYRHSLDNMNRFLNALDDVNTMDTPALRLAKKSMLAEKSFQTAGGKLMDTLKERGLLTKGLEQCLGTILDTHETHVYLLKQRINGA